MKDGDRRHPPSAPGSPGTTPVEGVPSDDLDGAGSCFAPWRREVKARSREASDASPFSQLNIDGLVDGIPIHYPVYNGRPVSEFSPVKKGRSNSSPFPLPAAFDVVPPSTGDVFTPLPTIVPQNAFDNVLPRELRLQILGLLVHIHEEDHARRVLDGRWSAIKASKHRWVGREQGVRELVRFSRVSKCWMGLVFDGQLWSQLNLRSCPKMPASQILHIASSSGPFITSLDLAGHATLQPSTLESLTTNLCLPRDSFGVLPSTRLTSIDLSGCPAITTAAFHHLLRRCPTLQVLRVKGLPAVTNETCEVIYEFNPRLTVLDMGRCKNITGAGIRTLASCILKDGQHLALRELRVSGLKGISDSVMHALGKAAPYLEVLDLSHCRDLHNSSLDSFISCDDDAELLEQEIVVLSAREAGRDPNEGRRYRRRLTRLRHLCLSSCLLLTDIACAHLAHTMPKLELLELGGIGSELKDDGLVLLLETLPNLRKLDLEDASDISDVVLRTITPPPESADAGRGARPGATPGSLLEHLVVSCAVQLSNEAFLALARNCRRLRVLEADSTRMSGAVVKEFAALVRQRALRDASITAVDCRAVGEGTVKELAGVTRPRLGWRAYEARRLAFLDGRDDEGLSVGQDECDDARVVLKTFYSWQTVDAVAAARHKRRKSRRDANGSGSSGADDLFTSRGRWWSPGGRRTPAVASPNLLDLNNNDREGCTIM
ncbi:RNI-like protein [Auriscalpium vulgare]|uniref:RNI-like protein n=1 Tax=Auriscalpium vulgare TaxID=40419 RepID=A0ACB8RZG3_9AGAM|nr:RNI-like protein [Auriscalpium vulgare]